MADHFHHEFKHTLAAFQHDIADKTVADDDVSDPFMDIPALNVANELIVKSAGIEKSVGILCQVVPLGFLGANVHEANGWFFALINVPGENAAHAAVSIQLFGLGADVRPDVDHHARALRRRH